jgi:hypothetical protein
MIGDGAHSHQRPLGFGSKERIDSMVSPSHSMRMGSLPGIVEIDEGAADGDVAGVDDQGDVLITPTCEFPQQYHPGRVSVPVFSVSALF